MSHPEFSSVKALLPALLAKLSKETGKAMHLGPVWTDVVGAVTSNHSRPLSLEGCTLLVEVESPRWEAAVKAQEPIILERFAQKLGKGVVLQLAYRVVEPR